jgi:hypothetical protein
MFDAPANEGLSVRKWDDLPISEPGLLSDVPISTYHGQPCIGPSVSSSGLRTFLNESPAHFYDEWSGNPDRAERDDTKAFAFGRACHHLILGEAEFSKHFAIRPDTYPSDPSKPWSGNASDCKAWLAKEALEGRAVLTGADVENIKGIATSLASEPVVQAGILNGLIEHSMVYQDPETGLWVKVRPDAIPTDAFDVSDLKTTQSVSDDAIDRTIGDYGYHVQGALIGMAVRTLFGRPMESFTLVFVEKTRPWCVSIRTLTPEDLALGEREAHAALRGIARCIDKGRWPGPAGERGDAAFARITPYARERIERRLAQLERELAA